MSPYFPSREDAAAWWNDRSAEQQLDPKTEAAYLDGLLRESESTDRSVLKVIWDRRSKVRDWIATNDRPAEQVRHTPEEVASLVEKVREAWTPEQAKDEPAQPKRTCGNCEKHEFFSAGESHGYSCRAPLPMWSDDGDGHVVLLDNDATYCAAWIPKQATPKPTHAAEDRPPKQHECPYGGIMEMSLVDCGKAGWLCDRCKEDRADARAGVGNRLLALEEYAAATDARASNAADVEKLHRDLDALRRALRATDEHLSFQVEDMRQQTETALRLAKVADAAWVNNTERLNALEARLPGPQTSTQDLGTHDMGGKA